MFLTVVMIVLYVLGAALGVLVAVSFLLSLVAIGAALAPVGKVPLRYNLRNLQARWKTTVVTALAFTAVIALLVAQLALVKGMDRLTEEGGRPGNVMILSDGATDEAFSTLPDGLGVESLPSDVQSLVLKNDQGQHLLSREVYVIVTHMLPHPKPGGRKRRFVQMRGLHDAALAAQIHEIQLQPGGRWFSPGGVAAVKRTVNGQTVEEPLKEIVLGDGVARTFGADLGRDSLGPGDIVHIGPYDWYVIGVMKPSGTTFGSEIWAKDSHIMETFGRKNSYSTYVARTIDEATGKLASHYLREFRGEKIVAHTEREYYSRLTSTNDQFRYTAFFIALVMAVGGVMGVMNTMFAAISHRTKDIGILRLLGYSRWQILLSFLFESLMIGLAGGVAGLVLGSLTDGWTLSSIVSAGPGGGGKSVVLRLIVEPDALAIGLGLAWLMAAVGGLVPSLSAMRLRPLESLR